MKQTTFAAAGLLLPSSPTSKTKHLILIVNSGTRKKDYYRQVLLSPSIDRVALDGFVFEEDHCERVASHESAFTELMQGRECTGNATSYPTIVDYIGNGILLDSILEIPRTLQRYRPRIIVCRETSHDVAHQSYERYIHAVKDTDDAVGRVFDWVKQHPDFCDSTTIVIRPEFGRDDDVNEHGHLHHSYGFYYTHRVASIFWGPDFNRGLDRKTVIRAVDLAPTLTKLFGVDAIHAQGRVIPGLLRIGIRTL